MTEFIGPAVMFAAGGLLAGIWLAGLWLDVRGLSRQSRPYRRLILGALARLFVVAAGFYLIITFRGHWADPLAALAGFVVVRYLVTARARRTDGVTGDAS